MHELKLWIIKLLLDDSWTLLDHEYCQTVRTQLHRVKLAAGPQYHPELSGQDLAQLKFQLARLETVLNPVLNQTVETDVEYVE